MKVFDRLAQKTAETQSQSGVTTCNQNVTNSGYAETRMNSGCNHVTTVTATQQKSKLGTKNEKTGEKMEGEEKERLERENMKCKNCKQWKKISFLSGLCILTNIEVSVSAYCRKIKKWP